jgi:myosin-5
LLVVLQLIEGRPHGLLTALDDEVSLPKGSDLAFLNKAKRNHADHACFASDRRIPHSFTVCHYAGDVAYDVTGFLHKNRDRLPEDLVREENCSTRMQM